MKRIYFFLILICLSICLSIFTSASSLSTSPYLGSFGSTQLQVLRDLAENVSPMPYVAWRDSEDDYCIFYSDTLDFNGSNFVASSGTCATVSALRIDNSYTTYYGFYTNDFDSLNLSTNNILVYSNLPGFPTLSEKEVIYLDTFFLITIAIIIFLICTRIISHRSRR